MSEPSDCVLLTIHPEHASKIYSGQKRAELRKSFPSAAQMVFLYETEPVTAITGGFLINEALKAPTKMAVRLANSAGVSAARARAYFGDRTSGWVIKIGYATRFSKPLRLQDLKELDREFFVPRTFSYLDREEGLTQRLLLEFHNHATGSIRLRPATESGKDIFKASAKSEIENSYEDIDEDFVRQITDPEVGMDSAFSTRSKNLLEVLLGKTLIGFTVLTEKTYGAWKSGPTILFREYRGFGVGRSVRDKIQTYCHNRGGTIIYCTCPESRPAVVAYLLNSGMKLCARLLEHLGSGRDEYVFVKKLNTSQQRRSAISIIRNIRKSHMVERIYSDNYRLDSCIKFFLENMASWYFRPHPELGKSIRKSIVAAEKGGVPFSEKARNLFAAFDRHLKPVAVALTTHKRSNMLKINIVATTRDIKTFRSVFRCILSSHANIRRFYVTVPVCEREMMSVLSEYGFSFEGILGDPFGVGTDHACFGLVQMPFSSKS